MPEFRRVRRWQTGGGGMRWTESDLASIKSRRQALPVSAPRKCRPAKPRFEPNETQIQEAVWQHLQLRRRPGVIAFHVPNGDLRHPTVAARLNRMGVMAGIPDFALVIEGRAYFLELKRQRGSRHSHEQLAMHRELTAAGAVVATARGLDEALDVLNSWGALLPANSERSAA